jgi:hypothetical protein
MLVGECLVMVQVYLEVLSLGQIGQLKTVFILGELKMIKYFILLLLMISCSTSTVTSCSKYIGIEYQNCVNDVELLQHGLWRDSTLNGYYE